MVNKNKKRIIFTQTVEQIDVVVGGFSGGQEARPSSLWCRIGYYAFIHLQISTREGHCVSSGTDRYFSKENYPFKLPTSKHQGLKCN